MQQALVSIFVSTTNPELESPSVLMRVLVPLQKEAVRNKATTALELLTEGRTAAVARCIAGT